MASERAEKRFGRVEEYPRAVQPVPHRQDAHPRQDKESQQRDQRPRHTGTRGIFSKEY